MSEFTVKNGQMTKLEKKVNPISLDGRALPLAIRKIKCPNYFILKPGCYGFERVPNDLKNLDVGIMKEYNLKNWKWKRDKYGRKIPKWSDYEQPVVSSAFAIEHIYDPNNWVCRNQCRGRCLEGHGKFNQKSVKRLNG